MIIHSKFRPLLSHGITVECTFHHNDKTRKSYNFVEVVYSARDHGEGYIAKTVTKTFKPQSAEMTFQSMLQNKHFFVQETAFKRIYEYYQKTCDNQEFIAFVKLLLGTDLSHLTKNEVVGSDAEILLIRARELLKQGQTSTSVMAESLNGST